MCLGLNILYMDTFYKLMFNRQDSSDCESVKVTHFEAIHGSIAIFINKKVK